MTTIKLNNYYPHLTECITLEVSEEIAVTLSIGGRLCDSYKRRKREHDECSLDGTPGFESDVTRPPLKIAFVAAVSFFGTSFTIMSYHNDIGISAIFEKFYIMVMGNPGNSAVLEVSYSIGLSLGIIIFFNHIGGRRITKDPTPIEVEMRVYEEQVNKALIETASREGKEET